MRVQQKITRDDLLAGIRRQGIDTRQIGDGGLAVAADNAVLAVHRHTGKVADVLVGAGKLVEKCRFTAVLVAGQGKAQRAALGNLRTILAVMIAGGLAQLAYAWVGDGRVPLLTAGGAIRFVDIFHFNFRGVCQAQSQLIPTQLHLDRVAHRCDLAQGDFGAGGQPHIQQVMTQFALPANRAQHSILPNF